MTIQAKYFNYFHVHDELILVYSYTVCMYIVQVTYKKLKRFSSKQLKPGNRLFQFSTAKKISKFIDFWIPHHSFYR